MGVYVYTCRAKPLTFTDTDGARREAAAYEYAYKPGYSYPTPLEAAQIASREIKAILRKHGLAGGAHMVADTRTVFIFEFPATVGITTQRNKEGQRFMRVRARREEFDTEAAAHKFAEDTAAVIFGLRDLAAMQFDTMDRFAKELDKQWNVEHESFADPRSEDDDA